MVTNGGVVADLELCGLSVARASKALHARTLSPLELTESYLSRIERLNPRVNAYITVTAERARSDARRATEELAAGRSRGPLHGIPMGLKDLYETDGIRTTGGARSTPNTFRRKTASSRSASAMRGRSYSGSSTPTSTRMV